MTAADLLLAVFASAAGVVLVAVALYPLVLLTILLVRRGRPLRADSTLPRVAVVVPTRNEEGFISAKLEDLKRTNYPPQLLSIWVVDGASSDRTREGVLAAIATGQGVRLLEMDATRGKSDQLRFALSTIDADVIVVTDADTDLAPDCIAELARVLWSDPRTGLVGATIHPCSPLPEEHVHWTLLNALWWLEGEALSFAVAPGPCYALRPAAVTQPIGAAEAEDLHLAQAVATAGYCVRTCRGAHAWERRVPQDIADVLRYRRRRGSLFLRELRRPLQPGASLRNRIVRLVRLAHLVLVPRLSVLAAAVFLLLLLTPHWPHAVALGVAAGALPLAGIAAAASAARPGARASTAMAVVRWAGLMAFVLLGLQWSREDLR